eukprot:752425-Pleurochrysis_carterae.AAC.1
MNHGLKQNVCGYSINISGEVSKQIAVWLLAQRLAHVWCPSMPTATTVTVSNRERLLQRGKAHALHVSTHLHQASFPGTSCKNT